MNLAAIDMAYVPRGAAHFSAYLRAVDGLVGTPVKCYRCGWFFDPHNADAEIVTRESSVEIHLHCTTLGCDGEHWVAQAFTTAD